MELQFFLCPEIQKFATVYLNNKTTLFACIYYKEQVMKSNDMVLLIYSDYFLSNFNLINFKIKARESASINMITFSKVVT